MQANPEDYAFTCVYSPERLLKQLAGLQRGLIMRLVIFAALIAYAGYTIYQQAQDHELVLSTILALCFVGAACVLVITTLVIVSRAQPGARSVEVSVVTLLVALSLLLGPQILLLRVARNFSRYDVFENIQWSATAIMIALGVTLATLIAGAVSVGLWRSSDGESHGFIARRLASLAVGVSLFTHVATGFLVSYLNSHVARLDIDPTVDMWYYELLGDAQLWSISSGLMLALPLGFAGFAVLQMANLAWTISDMATGPALRVDPAGLVVAASHGPVRVVWDDVEMLSAQAHSGLPGHELIVKSDTGFSWKVPFIFLDSLPGSIDSAIRAATDNSWSLDVTRLNRVI